MADFKSAEQILAAKDSGGVPRRRPEIQDETFWREKVVTARESALAGKIYGLVSWDPDLRRSFSARPTEDPFALTRTRFPTGRGAKLPRRIAYFLPPDSVPVPGPTPGTLVPLQRPWRLVVLESQLLYEDLLPRTLAVPGRPEPIEAEPARRRMPDDARTEIWLHQSVEDSLEKHKFRVLPVDADKLFTRPGQATALREAFGGVPVLPADGLARCQRLAFTTTDWNLPLAATPGGAMASHILKGRNTHVSVFVGQMRALGIRFGDGAPAVFRHREIYLAYETLVSVVTLDPATPAEAASGSVVPGAATEVRPVEYQSTLRKDVATGEPPPILKRVADTRTRFNEPLTFVTMETKGEFRKNEVAFVTDTRLVMPLGERPLQVVRADGTRRVIQYDPRAKLVALVTDLAAIHRSLVATLPSEIATRLK